MKIKTDQPFLQNREKITDQIARFWDQLSEGWRSIWGIHIHHGYYDENKTDEVTPLEAQEKLIAKLVENVAIMPGSHILDAGCGMGGSSLYLAKKYQARVTGITLSQAQARIAAQLASGDPTLKVSFKIEDALSLSCFADHSFDVVWSLESCEQFFNKTMFVQQAKRVLKPGGKLMLATWCSHRDEYEGKLAKAYRKLCAAFDLPYMPTRQFYENLLTAEQFKINYTADWSSQVKKSWDIGVSLVNVRSFFSLLSMSGWRGLRFSRQIRLMRKAFHDQRVQYGVFVASTPEVPLG